MTEVFKRLARSIDKQIAKCDAFKPASEQEWLANGTTRQTLQLVADSVREALAEPNYHAPLHLPADRTDRIAKARTADEACISAGMTPETPGRCGKRFEFASGEMTTPCELPLGHEGRCKGFVLGSPAYWSGQYASEEEEYRSECDAAPAATPAAGNDNLQGKHPH